MRSPRPLVFGLFVVLLVSGFATTASAAKKSDDDTSWRYERKGPLAHLDARQRAKFNQEIGFSYPLLILGGVDLAAGVVVLAASPYYEQGLVAVVSGGLAIAGGLSLMIHTLVDWGIGPPRQDRWSTHRPQPRLAAGPGLINLRW